MRETYVVILNTGSDPYAYGPFHDGQTAYDFAAYLTEQVDPATVVLLRDPQRELLAYWKQQPSAVQTHPDYPPTPTTPPPTGGLK